MRLTEMEELVLFLGGGEKWLDGAASRREHKRPRQDKHKGLLITLFCYRENLKLIAQCKGNELKKKLKTGSGECLALIGVHCSDCSCWIWQESD